MFFIHFFVQMDYCGLFWYGLPAIEIKPYYYKTQMEKIKAVHAQITGNIKERYTIEALSVMYEIPATTMKKCFKDVYGDSIYSYQKRYRINLAASMLIQDERREIQEIAASVGYENPGKFSVAFRIDMDFARWLTFSGKHYTFFYKKRQVSQPVILNVQEGFVCCIP